MAWKLFGGKDRKYVEQWNYRTMFGPHMGFAAKEAYKLLRTNLTFSFSDEGRGHVIGITSAIQGEGKSSTACNAAYSLAETGNKVLLLEADLRRPSIASKLNLAATPGLTNVLVARWEYEELIQHCSAAPGMDVITCGDIPPNPSELLSSNRMAQFMEELTQEYDYIIVDLPPVTVVSDAVAMSKLLDGIVLVVRDSVSDRKQLTETMRQLNLVQVRILGFVYREGARNGGKSHKGYSNYYTSSRKSRTNAKPAAPERHRPAAKPAPEQEDKQESKTEA